jgi:hypothetical protein
MYVQARCQSIEVCVLATGCRAVIVEYIHAPPQRQKIWCWGAWDKLRAGHPQYWPSYQHGSSGPGGQVGGCKACKAPVVRYVRVLVWTVRTRTSMWTNGPVSSRVCVRSLFRRLIIEYRRSMDVSYILAHLCETGIINNVSRLRRDALLTNEPEGNGQPDPPSERRDPIDSLPVSPQNCSLIQI